MPTYLHHGAKVALQRNELIHELLCILHAALGMGKVDLCRPAMGL